MALGSSRLKDFLENLPAPGMLLFLNAPAGCLFKFKQRRMRGTVTPGSLVACAALRKLAKI